ncbi:MAG: leucine-rich repeat domain-containing protein [Oscillospiraceae bacterium]|nr:leucine-rich repeat domain-containing protein [Oscillospiraceae bacterium]
MKQRKIITWALVLLTALSLLSVAAFGDDTEETDNQETMETSSNGQTLTATASGDGWTLDEDGVLTISSDTGMSSWASSRSTYASDVKSVVIEASVTTIGNDAFRGCTGLTTITILDGVTTIGGYAFYDCTSLTNVTLGSGITEIPAYTFSGCTSLTSVTMSCAANKNIAENAFDSASTTYTITLTHTYSDAPVFTWAEDYSAATVTFTCDEGDDTVTETCEVTSKTTAATCTTAGETVYTASVTFEGVTYTDEQTVAIPATGHTYDTNTFSWNWSEDYSSATISFSCIDCDDVHTENATVTSEVTTAATETEAGVTVYTAVAKFNDRVYANVQAVTDISATGHSYGDPVFTWAEDGKSAVASFTCETCGDVQSVIAAVTSEVKTAATAAEAGVTLYTAAVTFDGVEYTDTKELADIPATGEATEPPAETATPSASPTATAAASPAGAAPSTGDEASPLLWAILAAVCAVALGAALALARKERTAR